MHNGTIMQFFIFIVVENSILRNPYSDYLEIFCSVFFDNQKMQDIARIWVYVFDKKQAQTELTNVWHSTLTGSWQKLVSSMSNFTASFRQTSGQAGGKAVF